MKIHWLNFSFLIATPLLVLSCKSIDITDGQIPNEYLPLAKKLEGIYHGQFNGIPGDLVITLEGNRPVVTYKNKSGTDILNNSCESSLTFLKEISIGGDDKSPAIDSATFGFDPGLCGLFIRGRTIRVDVEESNGKTRLNLSLLKDIDQRVDCNGGWWPQSVGQYDGHHGYDQLDRDIAAPPRPRPPPYPYPNPGNRPCTPESQYIYLYGIFSR